MNEHDATEIAYINGYNKAVEDFAERARTMAFDNIDDANLIVLMYKAIDRIVEELERGTSNASL